MFKVRQHEPKSLRGWWLSREQIDFKPPYQRAGSIWSKEDQQILVDSVLNKYDLPKIYLADFTEVNTQLNRSRLPYAIIDGRQRMEALFSFFENRLPLRDTFRLDTSPRLKLGGLTYSDLTASFPQVATIFEEHFLHVMSVVTDDEAKINELFIRLNRSKPLTGAEIRNAMTGPVADAIRQLSQHLFFTDRVRFNRSRGQDKNLAAKLLLLEFRGKLVDTKKVKIDRFVKEGEQAEYTDLSGTTERCMAHLDRLSGLFGSRDVLLSTQGQIPLYYWLVRNHPGTSSLRHFLVEFERARKDAQKIKDGDSVDPELSAYNLMNRSTNDQDSLVGRYDILLRRYSDF